MRSEVGAISVTDVEVLDGYFVRLTFSDGTVGDLDLGPKLWGPAFQPLVDDPTLFRQVRVDPEARTVVWPNGADLAPEALYQEVRSALTPPLESDSADPRAV